MKVLITLRRLAAALAAVAFMAAPISLRAENITYPTGSGAIDVKAAPYNAVGDGVADDTAAIQAALNAARGNMRGRTVYFPNGTYRVTDRLVMTDHAVNHRTMNLQGQSRAGVVIRLADNTPAFNNVAAPRALLTTHQPAVGAPTFQNSAFSTSICNLTLDIGSGNPGAAGLIYIASNQGTLRDVTIRTSDPAKAGYAGLDMALVRMPGPALVKNVLIEGFGYGIRALEGQYSMVFEHITVKNQTIAGVFNGAQILSFRKLTSQNTVPAITQQNAGASAIGFTQGMVVVVDGNFTGGAAANPAINLVSGYLFARNVTTAGYGHAINDRGTPVAGPYLSEWKRGDTESLFPSPQVSMNLPVRETPELPWDDPTTWANVRTFGATAGAPIDATGDDSDAIQAAMNSGATTVFFPNTATSEQGSEYVITKTITVGPNVRRIIGFNSAIRVIAPLTTNGGAVFKFVDGNQPTVMIEALRCMNATGNQWFIEQASSKTLVLKNLLIRRGYAYRNTGFGDVFIEDFHSLANGMTGAGPAFIFKNQKVWARQLNPETYNPEVLNDGSKLWVLGLKTEQKTTLLKTINGGWSEVIGGLSLISETGANPNPAFINENSNLSVVHGEYRQNATRSSFTTVVSETRGSETRTLLSTDVPSRPAAYDTAPCYMLPLYTGYTAAAPVPVVNPLPTARGNCSVTVAAPTARDYRGELITGETLDPRTYTADQGGGTITWVYQDYAGNSTFQTQTVIVDKPALQRLTLTAMGGGRWRVRNPNCYSVAFTWDVYRGTERGSGTATPNSDVFFNTTPGPKTVRLFVNGQQVDVKSGN